MPPPPLPPRRPPPIPPRPSQFPQQDDASASVTVQFDRPLPQVCARCGAPATTTTEFFFFEQPTKKAETTRGIANFLLAMLSGYLVGSGGGASVGSLGAARGKLHKTPLPFCEAHRGLRKSQEMLRGGMVTCGGIALMILVIAIVVPIALSFQKAKNPHPPSPEESAMIITAMVCVWLAFVAASFLCWKRLKKNGVWIVPKEVTETSVTLDRVSPAFAAAVENAAPR